LADVFDYNRRLVAATVSAGVALFETVDYQKIVDLTTSLTFWKWKNLENFSGKSGKT